VAKYILTRLAWSALIVIVSSIVIFLVLRVLPGDPVLARLGASTGVDPAAIERLRVEAGLNDPLLTQYFTWASGIFRGNFGTAYTSQFPVTSLIAERLPVTLELTALAMTAVVAIAVPLAIASVYRQASLADRGVRLLTSIGIAVPLFIVALVFILIFSTILGWLPSRGYIPFAESPTENLKLMILPVASLVVVASPLLIRHMRESMLETESEPFVRTALGKGAVRTRVVFRHVLRSSLVPSLTMLGLLIGYTLAGTVVVEYIFGLPGIGSLALESALKRDYAVLQSVVLLIVVMFVVTTFIVDIVNGLVDPRVRLQATHG
jgi:peptide/nickel transport system permease protein